MTHSAFNIKSLRGSRQPTNIKTIKINLTIYVRIIVTTVVQSFFGFNFGSLSEKGTNIYCVKNAHSSGMRKVGDTILDI